MQGPPYLFPNKSCRSTAHPEAGEHLARLVSAIVYNDVIAAEGQSVFLYLIEQCCVFLIACRASHSQNLHFECMAVMLVTPCHIAL